MKDFSINIVWIEKSSSKPIILIISSPETKYCVWVFYILYKLNIHVSIIVYETHVAQINDLLTVDMEHITVFLILLCSRADNFPLSPWILNCIFTVDN